MAEDRGVLYLLCGGYAPGQPLRCSFIERLVVSMYTMREHWAGSATLLCETAEHAKALSGPCKAFGVAIQCFDPTASGRNAAYAMKPFLPTWSPYECTVFLDADTAIVGDFSDLFAPKLALTQFSEWQTQGNKMAKRIAGLRGKSPQIDALVEKQLAKSYPAINTGVLGWHRGFAPLSRWAAVSIACGQQFIIDELAMQVLSQEFGEDCTIFDCRYNCSPIHAGGTADVRIWHFHGDKSVKHPLGKAKWWPRFLDCYKANPGGFADWAGQFDPYLGPEMKREGLRQ